MIYGIFGFWRILSAFCLVALFLRVAGQASNQSITADEAFNYNNFLRSSLGNVFTAHYDANNHVLQTALCWLSIHVFGVTELSLRIPSLVGSILYFYTVFQLASIRFNRSFLHLVATLALASNPYLLDFFTVARGYGLALAFLALAVLAAVRSVSCDEANHKLLFYAGLWSALSVASNLAFLFPAGGLQTALLLSLLRCSGQQRLGAVVLSFIDSAGGPFLLWSFLILVIPLLTARPDAFYFGAQRWHETLGSLVSGSFFHNLEIPLLSRWPASFWHLCAKITTTFAPVLSGLILVAALLLVFRPSSSGHSMPTLTGLTFSVTVALLWLAHVLAHVKLPIMRTGVYFLFLFPLALLSFLPCEKDSPAGHLGWAFLPIIVFLVLLYVPQANAKATVDWRYDAATKKFAETIEMIRRYTASPNIHVGGSWVFEPTLNFYRVTNHYDAWQPIVRHKSTDAADFYVLTNTDRDVVKTLNLRVLLDDPVSKSILAVPSQMVVGRGK